MDIEGVVSVAPVNNVVGAIEEGPREPRCVLKGLGGRPVILYSAGPS